MLPDSKVITFANQLALCIKKMFEIAFKIVFNFF